MWQERQRSTTRENRSSRGEVVPWGSWQATQPPVRSASWRYMRGEASAAWHFAQVSVHCGTARAAEAGRCMSWQSEQESAPSGTGWWFGSLNWATWMPWQEAQSAGWGAFAGVPAGPKGSWQERQPMAARPWGWLPQAAGDEAPSWQERQRSSFALAPRFFGFTMRFVRPAAAAWAPPLPWQPSQPCGAAAPSPFAKSGPWRERSMPGWGASWHFAQAALPAAGEPVRVSATVRKPPSGRSGRGAWTAWQEAQVRPPFASGEAANSFAWSGAGAVFPWQRRQKAPWAAASVGEEAAMARRLPPVSTWRDPGPWQASQVRSARFERAFPCRVEPISFTKPAWHFAQAALPAGMAPASRRSSSPAPPARPRPETVRAAGRWGSWQVVQAAAVRGEGRPRSAEGRSSFRCLSGICAWQRRQALPAAKPAPGGTFAARIAWRWVAPPTWHISQESRWGSATTFPWMEAGAASASRTWQARQAAAPRVPRFPSATGMCITF